MEDNTNTQTSQKKPCRVCDQFKTWNKTEKKKLNSHGSTSTPNQNNTSMPLFSAFATATGVSVSSENKLQLPKEYFDCPLDSQSLGRNTWSFLHTMAAYYPETPTAFEKNNMQSFLNSFSWVYPCGNCADHLRKHITKSPPTLNNAKDLSTWLCNTHNKVNKRLGKPIFDCSAVFERWRDGPDDGRCDFS
ncbi:hypothetical protein BB561_005555 [Smittium simulii]|uniref:Sulfhydryl oxidase n=1 Tax=Smittium simulii TaxID=133385 RepID=A0A2T9Y9T5_9FUNG|nr:hypothetical protein BB561_005555 [Smittium simulii]